MNSIISIIMALVITVSNLFGFAPVTEFFEKLFSDDVIGEEIYTEELPQTPSDEETSTDAEEILDFENENLNTVAPEEASDVKLVPAEGSTTIIDENTMAITGLKEFITEAELRETFLAVEGDGCFEIEYASSKFNGWTGTGTKVKLYDNQKTDEPVAVYTIVIYGDVDGDSITSPTDSNCTNDEFHCKTNWSRQGFEEYDFYKTMAADLDKDGVVDDDDSCTIKKATTGILTIDQNTGNAVHN